MALQQEQVDTSPKIADEIKYTTCYMCACRCGIKVHLKDGQVKYIEGNPNHPVNKGVLCGKGSSGIMQHLSPARLSAPLKRTGPRGSGEFEEISWEEAFEIATGWLSDIRATDPSKLAFFTGRDQSQSLTAWEFGEPDWEHTRYFMMFGVAEDHDSNPIKSGLGQLKTREDAKYVSVNPVRTGYSAIADEWIGIRPGTDGLFVMALVHELLKAQKVDLDFLVRYTNAAWLVRDEEGHPENGLFLRGDDGSPLCWEKDGDRPVNALRKIRDARRRQCHSGL